MAHADENGNETTGSKGPRASAVDAHVGNRIKLRRTLLGMSQERLGEALGLTFQQIQKYERGINRVSASRLFDVARALEVSIGFFYDDLAPELGGTRYGADYATLGSRPAAAALPAVSGFAETQQGFGAPPPHNDQAHAGAAETGELLSAFGRIADPAMRRHVIALVKGIAT